MKKQVPCLRCKELFFVTLQKKYFISRANVFEEKQVESEENGKVIIKNVKVPQSPFKITTNFLDTLQYQNNSSFTVVKKILPESIMCKSCTNQMKSREETMRVKILQKEKFLKMKNLKETPETIKLIDEEEAKDFDRQLAKLLAEGRIRPQVVKNPEEKKET